MRRILLVVAALGLASCGSDKLNPAFAGNWIGAVTLTMGGDSFTVTAVLTLSLPSENTLTIDPVCLGSTGILTASGDGDTASWSGTFACPPVAFPSCDAVTVTLNSGTGTLSSDGKTLTVQASGTASGCSTASPFSERFVGMK
jgi:hypothetical protein